MSNVLDSLYANRGLTVFKQDVNIWQLTPLKNHPFIRWNRLVATEIMGRGGGVTGHRKEQTLGSPQHTTGRPNSQHRFILTGDHMNPGRECKPHTERTQDLTQDVLAVSQQL